MKMRRLLLLQAWAFFLCAAFGVDWEWLHPLPMGLACAAAAFL